MARTPDPGLTGEQFFPKPPAPGSNGIGIGGIGEVQLGTIPEFDWRQTVLSQYANSTRIVGIIERFFGYVDQTKNVDAFFDMIMNLDTAEGYGLDVWGRIVGVNRTLRLSTVTWFGFAEALPGVDGFNKYSGTRGYFGFAESKTAAPFGQGILYDGEALVDDDAIAYPSPIGVFYNGVPAFVNFTLDDLTYRNLILAKAIANICNGSVQSINALLLFLFPHRGNCYVTDGQKASSYFGFAESQNAMPFGQGVFYEGEPVPGMQIQYVFTFPLSNVEIAIVQQSGVLPKPTGVAASIQLV